MPNTHVIQGAVLNGRSVLMIEQTGDASVGSTPTQDNPQGVLSYTVWLDPDTYQVLQHQHALREVQNGVFADKVDTGISRITLDEVKDSADFPSGLFVFRLPAGTKLQTVTDPTPKSNP